MSKPNCNKLEEHLKSSVEHRAPIGMETFREHLRQCQSCAQLVRAHRLLETAIQSWRTGIPEVDLTDAIMNQMQQEWEQTSSSISVAAEESPHTTTSLKRNERSPSGTSGSTGKRFHGMTMATISAACLLALFTLLNHPGTTPTGSKPGELQTLALSNSTDSSNPKEINENAKPEIEGLVRDMGAAYQGLAIEMKSTLSETAELFSSVSFLGEQPGNSRKKEASPDPVPSLSNEWTENIKPIGKEVGKAFDFLFDSIPADPPNSI
ncbi:MAG: hypothetical protein Tsb009_09790 [Planctomycetaceae bacterium]